MHLVSFTTGGQTHWVFLREEPGYACRPLPVVSGVEFEHAPPRALHWWSDLSAPSPVLGRSVSDPTKYKLFPSPVVMHAEGYEALDGVPWVHRSWQEFLGSPHGRRTALSLAEVAHEDAGWHLLRGASSRARTDAPGSLN